MANHLSTGVPETGDMRTRQAEEGLTWKGAIIAILFALFFVVLTAIAIRRSEMVTGQYISNGVPPLPAFAVILFLSLLRPFLRRYTPRLAPSRAQMFLIYITVAVAVIFSGLYQVRAFLPHLVSLQYWGRSDPLLGQYARYFPSWFAPRDMQAIIDYFDGADRGAIPWHVWMQPLAVWGLFFGAIFVGVFSLVSLVQRQWIRNEKLSFPLLALPMALTSDNGSMYGGAGSRRMLFIIGFGIAAVFNGVNILHIIYPSVPSIGFSLSLAEYFPNRPWTPLQHATLYFMLEAVGIGYFVPLEITFSTWFFYLANRLFAVAGTMAGYDEPGFPFTQEQCAGGYLAVGLILIWSLRRTLRESFLRSFGRAEGNSGSSDRWAWIGLAGSSLLILAFCQAAGFSLKLALPYFAIIGVFVLVYARIRAETGVPLGIVWPYSLPKEMLLNVISIPRALNWGGTGSFVLFSSLAWLSRHHYPMEQAAYHLDGIKLSEEAKIPRRILVAALLCAFVVGLAAACWIHLSAYYDLGSNMAGGGTGSGEYRATVALQEYQQMASRIVTPPPQSMPRLAATAGGFVFVGGLSLMRRYILGFPFHPLGFLIATAYGDHNTGWFALMIAWFLKALILRFGGLPLYRRGMPFFLGLAIGHLFLGGVFWPFFSTLFGAQAANSYHLLFGG